MEVRLLGPLELILDGRVTEVKGPGERALLALLVTQPGSMFAPDRLVDALWGEALPANPANALQLRVSRLRKVVGPALTRTPAGYRLDIDPQGVDAVRFTQLLSEGAFEEALALWRGPPLAEFIEYEWARAEAVRLEELRATALEEHVDARLAAGEHVALVAELEGLVAAGPLRERRRAQLMTALYRGGRTAEALEVFQSFRRLLADELGLEPSAELRRLEGAILREDPSLRARATGRPAATNLPAPLTSIVGRDAHLARLTELVSRTRLVTLVGPGGVGKTTLAVAAARQATAEYRDGVWFVPLAGVTDPARIPEAVVEALGVADPGGSSPQRLATSWLASRQALLVVDNCEHLADACARFVAQLLRSTGEDLHVVATSREALAVPGEVQMPVPPLDPEQAVVLFSERATSVAPDFSLGADDDDIRRICERLDGIPLAIELAAARVKTVPPQEIAARLDDRFRLLTAGPRTAEARHQTLRATVEWSHTLLERHEQELFRRVGIFRGGWTLAAAEEICAESGDADVLDTLSRLVDRSLVVAEAGRFRLLETIRAYAEERLDQAGERANQERRHAAFFTDLAERAQAQLRGPDQRVWLEALRAEDANLRQALDWACSHAEAELALRLAGALGWYWYVGRQVDGRSYVGAALESADGGSEAARGRALQALSLAVRPVGCIVHPTPEGARAAEESLALFRRAGDAAGAGLSQLLVAVEGVAAGDADRYLSMVGQARATLRTRGDAWGLALADFVEMEIRLHHGQVDHALALGQAASQAFDELDDDWGRSAVLLHLGYGLRVAGRVDEAEQVLNRAVELSRAGELPNNLAGSFVQLGEAALHRGDPDGAYPSLVECERIARELGNDTWLTQALLGRGAAARLRGQPVEAVRHYTKALELSMGAGFRKGTVHARIGLLAAQLDADAHRDVIQDLEAARSEAQAVGDVALVAGATEQLARAAALQGRPAVCSSLLSEAQDLRSSGRRPRGVLDERDVQRAQARVAQLTE